MLNMMTAGRDSQNFSNPDLFDPDCWDQEDKWRQSNLHFIAFWIWAKNVLWWVIQQE